MKTGISRLLLVTSISFAVLLVERGPNVLADNISALEAVQTSKVFAEPLLWAGSEPPSATDSEALRDALTATAARPAFGTVLLEDYLIQHSNSAWAPALRANLAICYRIAGRYSRALQEWETAWIVVKDGESNNDRLIGDFILGQWTQLLSSLGRTDKLRELSAYRKIGHMQNMNHQRLFSSGITALGFMEENPGLSYKCGTLALYQIARSCQATGELSKILEIKSPQTGFSAARLIQIARSVGIDLVAVRRTDAKTLIVPSIVHWRQNHYAALTQKQNGRIEVIDSTFGKPQWLTEEVVNEETDDIFLVPAGLKPADWVKLQDSEAEIVHGKGSNTHDPSPTEPPCHVEEGRCRTCPPPGANGSPGHHGPPPYIQLWAGSSTGSSGGGCSGCSSGQMESQIGMPTWRVTEPYISLWIEDVPMKFTVARQEEIALYLSYHQRETRPDDANIFNLGPYWNMNLLSFIDVTNMDNSAFASCDATTYGSGGGTRFYSQTPPAQGDPAYDYQSKTKFKPYSDGTTLTNVEITYPNGAVWQYGLITHLTTLPTQAKRAFLTKKIAPNSLTTLELLYSTNSGRVLLTSAKDGLGTTALNLYYSTNDPAQITVVSNRYGDTVHLGYDTNRMLTNVTDVVGLSNSFDYLWTNGLPVMSKLTTPYGETTFEYLRPNGVLYGGTAEDDINRAIRVREPNGDTHMFMYRDGSLFFTRNGSTIYFMPPFYTSVPSIPTGTNTLTGLCDSYMENRNTFYWGPLQYSSLSTNRLTVLTTNDYWKASIRNWLHQSSAGQLTVGETLNMQREPTADGGVEGQKTWYAYAGKTNYVNMRGSSFLPSYVAWLLPNGETRWIYRQYDAAYNITSEQHTRSTPSGISTRTDSFQYSTDLDLEYVFQGGVTVADDRYDHHMLRTNKNALAEETIYSYDANWRLTNISRPNGLTTVYSYNSDGWLTNALDVEVGRNNNYSYSNGRLLQHADERGLVTTHTWDALGRLTGIGYPDNTHESNRYTYLDLTAHKDRLGNWTYYGYDQLRRKVAQTNALTNVTLYSYCTCGGLDSVTDPMTNTTHFYYDAIGRQVRTLFPDGSSISNRLDFLGRVTNRLDSAGDSITIWYNHQGLLSARSNSIGVLEAFNYDVLDRVTNSIDANGIGMGFRLDALGRVDRRYPGNAWEEQFEFSSRGVTRYSDVGERFTYYGRDAAGRKIVETNNNSEVVGYSYNSAGDLLFLTNAVGAVTRWGYDEFGRVTNKVDALGIVALTYRYDANGRLTNRWSNERGNTSYRYDAMGNLTNVDYTSSSDISLAYDANSRLTTMVDGIGSTRYTYTSIGALSSEDGPWPNDTVSFDYFNQMRSRTTLQWPSANSLAWCYAYDSGRRLTNITSGTGSFSYQYDASRKQQIGRLTFPNGAYISNSFSAMGQVNGTFLKNSSDAILNSHEYTYSSSDFGEVTRQTRADGSYVDYGYNGIEQLTSALGKEAGGASRLNEAFRYSYDAAGNLRSRTNDAHEQWFTVNDADQLTGMTRSNTLTVVGTTSAAATNVTVNSLAATRYSDNTFAKSGFTLADGTNTFTALAQDSYGRTSSNTVSLNLPVSVGFDYEANGNMVADGIHTFEYDDENQLTAVQVYHAWRSEFFYDGKMRRRIRKEFTWQNSAWLQTNEIRYVYSGNLVIQERDALNTPVVTYTRGLDLNGTFEGAGGIGGLLGRTDDRTDATIYYHADRLGNVTMLINAQQILVAKYLYDPFGNTLSATGPMADANLYRFSTREWHPLSGLFTYPRRYYSSSLQRWINRDPVGEYGGANLYAALDNDPVGSIESLGLCPRSCTQICKSALGDDRVNKTGSGGVVCEGGRKCPCFFGYAGVVPGQCPELDKIVETHEQGHVNDAQCDPSKGAEPHRAPTKPGVNNDAVECVHRQKTWDELQPAIDNAQGECKRAMLALSNSEERWLRQQNCFKGTKKKGTKRR